MLGRVDASLWGNEVQYLALGAKAIAFDMERSPPISQKAPGFGINN